MEMPNNTGSPIFKLVMQILNSLFGTGVENLNGSGPLDPAKSTSIIDCTAENFICWLPNPTGLPEGFEKWIIFRNANNTDPTPVVVFTPYLNSSDEITDIGVDIDGNTWAMYPDNDDEPPLLIKLIVENGKWRVLYTVSSEGTTHDTLYIQPGADPSGPVNVAPLAQQQFALVAFSSAVIPLPAAAIAAIGGVTWSVVEVGGGSVTQNGLYTAPAAPGDYTIHAQLNAAPDHAYGDVTVHVA